MSDAPQSRASFATISPTTPHDTGRKFTRPTRENQWVKKYGRKHHNYPAAKAPYPLSYDKDILDRDAIDMSVVQTVMCSPRSVAEQTPPQRVLDLGCGTGAWIIHTARNYWRDTEFVGFDLVNIQIPTVYLERQLAQRITWQHGNFLSQRLPFVDCYFDFVRIAYVASGVPENKWTVIFEEINRVLAPNGQVEVTEEDILFPIVPRWFTDPLRAKPRTRASSKASNVTMNGAESEALPPSPPNSPTSERTDFEPPPQDEIHEHALLELLFVSLHESRFINMKPTNILPVYFTPFFSRCMQGPTLHFGMPFLTPLRPLPAVRQSIPTSDSSTRVESTIFARPPSTLATLIGQHSPTTEAPTLSVNPEFRRSSSFGTDSDASTRSPQDRSVTPTLTTPEPSVKGDDDDIWRNWVLPDPSKGGPWVTPTPEGQRDPNMLPGPALRGLSKFSSRARAVVLWHSYLGVRGCQEAMWEELLLLQGTQVGRKRLLDLGWVPSKPPDQPLSETMGELEQKDAEMKWEAEDRARFEEMFDVYERDIRVRAAFWYSSTELGLPLPKREPLPKADLAEEERRRKAILDSRALLSKDDSDVPTKSVRTFVGYKITEGEETLAQNALSGMNGSLGDDL